MHWVRGEPGGVDYERELVLVEHPPARVVFLSAADTELSCAVRFFPDEVTLVHAGPLRQPVSADAYVEEILPDCGLVVARLLGGGAYFPHLVDAIERLKQEGGQTRFLLMSGSDQFDPDLADLSDFDAEIVETVFRHFVEGGAENFGRLGGMIGELAAGKAIDPKREPKPTESYGLYRRFEPAADIEPAGSGWLLFYRAWYQADDLGVIDALGEALAGKGLSVSAYHSFSLRDAGARSFLLKQEKPDVIFTLQSFSIACAAAEGADFFRSLDCPVLQVSVSAVRREDWALPNTAMIPSEVAMNVALPELDGRVMATVAGFKEAIREPGKDEACVPRRLVAEPGQIEFIARLGTAWSRLRKLDNGEKRIAVLLSNYPNRDGRIGNGVGLDTPASTVRLLEQMRDAGYAVDPLPRDGEELMAWLREGVTNDRERSFGRAVFQTCDADLLARELDRLPAYRREEISRQWGEWIGGEEIPVPGVRLGSVFVGIQPQRGWGEQSQAIYHSPELPPTPEYLAFYAWIRDEFRADAIVQIGKHGNLEWLPGRSVGLGGDDFPQLCPGPVPFLYSFIVNNPGEGSQAKRRTSAVIVDHLTPPLTRAGLYDDLRKVERLLEELAHAATLYPKRQADLEAEIRKLVSSASWKGEIPRSAGEDEIAALDNFLCEIKESQIRSGLHILGQAPEGERLKEFLLALLRTSSAGRPGLFEAIQQGSVGYLTLSGPERDTIYREAEAFVEAVIAGESFDAGTPKGRLARLATGEILPKLRQCDSEIRYLLAGLEGRFVPPGPAGAPTRGRLDVLPTGKNFYSLDPRTVPTETAWESGKRMAEALLERHRQEQGEYPKTVAMVIWGTSNMRTGGDDLAQALWLWGCEPVWDESSGRVVDFEIVPAPVLGRPRVDVLLRVSGFFRDAFGESMRLLATIPKRLCQLDEPAEINPLRARYLEEIRDWGDMGYSREEASERAWLRVFSSPPGAYGAGLLPLIDSGDWKSRKDLADVFCRWGNHAYDARGDAHEQEDLLRERLRRVEVVHQNQDNREHDILDSDDYFQFHGGLHAAIEQLSGQAPATYHGDSSVPDQPRVRTLREEFVRVLRGRALNPKWIEAMRRHGYKGAFEIAATVDYLYGYDATTGVAEAHQYDEVARRLLLDPEQQKFFRRHNPQAWQESVERLLEAADRELWDKPDPETIQALRDVHYSLESALE